MITLNLEVEEVNGLLSVLGELPSKTGAFLLILKIQEQLDPQVTKLPIDDIAG